MRRAISIAVPIGVLLLLPLAAWAAFEALIPGSNLANESGSFQALMPGGVFLDESVASSTAAISVFVIN